MTEVHFNKLCRILLLHSARLTPETVSEVSGRLAAMLESSRPDLVILNGDTLAGPTNDGAALLESFLSPVLRRGIPWTYTFGEGERKTGIEPRALDGIYASVGGCVTGERAEGIDGVTNAVIPMIEEGEVRFLLRLFDTHRETTAYEREYGSPGRSRLPYPLYSRYYMDGVRSCQTAWFDSDHDRRCREAGRTLRELFVFHTPTPEHAQIPLNQAACRFDGILCEDSKCQTVNGGIACAAAESRDVSAILCGHEEENDYFGNWAGMTLGVLPAFRWGAWLAATDGDTTEIQRIRPQNGG